MLCVVVNKMGIWEMLTTVDVIRCGFRVEVGLAVVVERMTGTKVDV